jgi:hypothetical protein
VCVHSKISSWFVELFGQRDFNGFSSHWSQFVHLLGHFIVTLSTFDTNSARHSSDVLLANVQAFEAIVLGNELWLNLSSPLKKLIISRIIEMMTGTYAHFNLERSKRTKLLESVMRFLIDEFADLVSCHFGEKEKH